MQRIAILFGLFLAGCTGPDPSPLARVLTQNDLLLRPDGPVQTRATLQLYPGGRGAATFASSPGLPVAFTYSLRRDVLCIDASAAVDDAPACSRVGLSGADVTLRDIKTGTVENARLAPRGGGFGG